MDTGQYLLLNLYRYRKTNNSLESILSDLYFAKRLPISIPVLELLVHEGHGLKQKLERMGCTIESIGNMDFVARIPPSCLIFQTSNVWNSDNEIRDAVVSIHKAAACKKSQIPLVPCEALTRDACTDLSCAKVHYSLVLNDRVTDVTAGLCSYLDLCKNEACKFIHVIPEIEPVVENNNFDLSQWIQCDIRYFPISSVFSNGIVSAFLIDPPWDIHMELTYGTLTDDEMRDLDMANVHSEDQGGFVFIWATTRTVEVARDCLRLWGYLRVDEIVWLKTNQIGGTVRSGRTGHWLNHNKEHCLVGMKGNVSWANVGHYRQDCDVIVSPVRENSRKPDELYSMIERIVGMNRESSPSRLCVELFGRSHNRRPGWVTLGNQLQGSKIFHPVLAQRLSECGMHPLVSTDS